MEEETPARKTKRKRLKPKHSLPPRDLSVEKQLEVLRAHVAASERGAKAVNYKAVAQFVDYIAVTVSKCNSFFEESGMILPSEKRGHYVPHENVVKYADLYDHKTEEAIGYLGDVLSRSWFGELTLKRLSISKAISRESLLRTLGAEAGGESTPQVIRGLNALVEYLEYSNVVQINEEGEISMVKVLGEVPQIRSEEPSEAAGVVKENKDLEKVVKPPGVSSLGVSVALNIDTAGWTLKDIHNLIRWLRGEETDEEGKE